MCTNQCVALQYWITAAGHRRNRAGNLPLQVTEGWPGALAPFPRLKRERNGSGLETAANAIRLLLSGFKHHVSCISERVSHLYPEQLATGRPQLLCQFSLFALRTRGERQVRVPLFGFDAVATDHRGSVSILPSISTNQRRREYFALILRLVPLVSCPDLPPHGDLSPASPARPTPDSNLPFAQQSKSSKSKISEDLIAQFCGVTGASYVLSAHPRPSVSRSGSTFNPVVHIYAVLKMRGGTSRNTSASRTQSTRITTKVEGVLRHGRPPAVQILPRLPSD